VKILATNFDLTDSLEKYILKKFSPFKEKMHLENISITLSKVKNVSTVQFLGRVPHVKQIIKIKQQADDMYQAVDKVHASVKEKINRVKTIYEKRKKRGKTPVQNFSEEGKRISIITMSRWEALNKMEKNNYNFWLFVDKETGVFTVIYKKEDKEIAYLYPVFE